MEYTVNGIQLQYKLQNNSVWGDDRVLLHDATDLTAHTVWHDAGFVISPLFPDSTDADQFLEKAAALLRSKWKESGLDIPNDFRLTSYHRVVRDLNQHLMAIDRTKVLPVAEFPWDIDSIIQRVSELCNTPLIAKNPYDDQQVFHFRVIRPGHRDNNPLHRDVWLEDYDNCINLYIPVAGSDEGSSLVIIPGSHLWSESRIERTAGGARIGELSFNVPAVAGIKGDFETIRPDPDAGQFILFSPYLIHGGAVNLNADTTRISIELRLWKK